MKMRLTGAVWGLVTLVGLVSCGEQRDAGDGGAKAGDVRTAEGPGEVLQELLEQKLGATNVTVHFSDENQVILNCDQPGEPAKRTWLLSYRGYKVPEGNSEEVPGLGQSATWANERDIGLVVKVDAERSFCLVTYRNDSMTDVVAAHKDEERGGRWRKEAIEIGREITGKLR
ncbi:MAG: hypothetical protein KF712_15755 [Akkermansiaceae bacterium]|nr:hypothetical protein [Akkermansiaceae bacterium]